MRILALVTDAFGGHGGIAKFNRDLLSALCAYPHAEKVTALPRLLPEPPGELPRKLSYLDGGLGGKLRYLRAAMQTARGESPDLIVCGHINLLPAAFLAKLFCRASIVLVIHGTDAWEPTASKLTNYLGGQRINALVSVSEFSKHRFQKWAKNGMASFILPNCIDLSRFTPGSKNSALLAKYGLGGKKVLLTVARLSAQEQGWKGIDSVIDIIPKVKQHHPDITYLIVGDGTDRPRLERKAHEMGIPHSVVFTGKVPEEQKVEFYRLADVFVMAGRAEGFGIVYLEAMSCGVPVIGSKVDASRETLRNGEWGVIVNPDDHEELCAGVLKSLQQDRKVPAGLEYFSDHNFQRRCHQILDSVVSTAHKTKVVANQ